MSSTEAEHKATDTASWLQQWPDGILGIDRDHIVRFVSTEAENLLGWPSHEAVGRNVHELLCVSAREFEHQLEQCPLCIDEIKSDAVSSSFWRRSDGYNVGINYRIFTVSAGNVNRALSFQGNHDLSHSVHEIEKWAHYTECNPSPIAEFDVDGHIIFGNSAFHQMLLRADFDAVGQSRLLPSNLAQLCRECAISGECRTGIEVSFDEQWWTWHFAPITTTQKGTVVGYAFDVSGRKRLELQDEEEKVHARQDFYAKMVHELRTPLNAIIGFSQVLSRRLEGLVHARDLANLKAIKVAGLQLNQMITNTLDAAKIEACKVELESEEFSVHEVFASVSEQLESLARAKGLDYEVICDSGVRMTSDRNKVRQIAVNLMSNAIKYTHQGRIRVTVNSDQAGRMVVFTINDTGIGIAQEDQKDLFTAFSRVHAHESHGVEGAGLGLALVAEFVKMLRGSVSVHSELDKGATFVVKLPLTI